MIGRPLTDPDRPLWHWGHKSIRNSLEKGAFIDAPGEYVDVVEDDLFSIDKKSQPDTIDAIYFCLSILCEQQEMIQDSNEFNKIWGVIFLKYPENPSFKLSPEKQEKAEKTLYSLRPKSSSEAYKAKEQSVFKQIDCATQFPKVITSLVLQYDNSYRHRLFNASNKLSTQLLSEAAEANGKQVPSLSAALDSGR